MFCILYSSFWLDSHFCEFWLTESYKSVCSHCIVEKNYTTITILGAVGFFGEQLPPRYSFIHYCDNVPNVASICFSDQDFPSLFDLVPFHTLL